VTRPHAADDFPAIRARMEELRRERAQASADDKRRSVSVGVDGPRRHRMCQAV